MDCMCQDPTGSPQQPIKYSPFVLLSMVSISSQFTNTPPRHHGGLIKGITRSHHYQKPSEVCSQPLIFILSAVA